VSGIGQQQFIAPALQDLPDRLPVNTRGFHHHVRHPRLPEPLLQFPQCAGRGLILPQFALPPAGADTNGHTAFMDIDPRATVMLVETFFPMPLRALAAFPMPHFLSAARQ
jgi:hypothetical protein